MWTECQAEFVEMVAVIHKFVTSWCYLQVKGVVFFEGDKLSQCRILHNCVYAIPVIPEILCILVLGPCCSVAITSPSPHNCCPHSAFAHRKEQQNSVYGFKCSVTWVKVQYFAKTVLTFPLQKPYTRVLTAYSSSIELLGILTNPP